MTESDFVTLYISFEIRLRLAEMYNLFLRLIHSFNVDESHGFLL